MNEEELKLLDTNTEIMTNTFELLGLKVLKHSFRPYYEEDEDGVFMIEIQSIAGGGLESNVDVKVNVYDEQGDLFQVADEILFQQNFAGFDTLKILFEQGTRVMVKGKTARVYAVKL